jgi:hypothetical protein
MRAHTNDGPKWAVLTVWGVVNAVNVLQAVGFLSRVRTGSMAVNHLLGYAIIALGIPSALALVAFVRARAGWLQTICRRRRQGRECRPRIVCQPITLAVTITNERMAPPR